MGPYGPLGPMGPYGPHGPLWALWALLGPKAHGITFLGDPVFLTLFREALICLHVFVHVFLHVFLHIVWGPRAGIIFYSTNWFVGQKCHDFHDLYAPASPLDLAVLRASAPASPFGSYRAILRQEVHCSHFDSSFIRKLGVRNIRGGHFINSFCSNFSGQQEACSLAILFVEFFWIARGGHFSNSFI